MGQRAIQLDIEMPPVGDSGQRILLGELIKLAQQRQIFMLPHDRQLKPAVQHAAADLQRNHAKQHPKQVDLGKIDAQKELQPHTHRHRAQEIAIKHLAIGIKRDERGQQVEPHNPVGIADPSPQLHLTNRVDVQRPESAP